jgi:hypothetical protein
MGFLESDPEVVRGVVVEGSDGATLVTYHKDTIIEGPRRPTGLQSAYIEAYGTCYPPVAGRGESQCWATHVVRQAPLRGQVTSAPSSGVFAIELWRSSETLPYWVRPEGGGERVRVTIDGDTVLVNGPGGRPRHVRPDSDTAIKPDRFLSIWGERVGDELRARFIED